MAELAQQRDAAASKNFSLITAILVWSALSVVSSLYVTIPMVTPFSESFHVSPQLAGWTGSAFSLFYAAGFLLAGPLADRYGRKQVMLSGLIALAIVSPMIGTVNSLSGVIVLRAIQGLAASLFPPAVISYVVEMFPPEKRVSTIGYISTGFLLAGIVGQVFSELVLHSAGWHAVFFVLGTVYLVCSVMCGWMVPSGQVEQKSGNLFPSLRDLAALFRQKQLLVCYLITVTLFLSFVSMYTALGSYPGGQFSLDSSQILLVRVAGAAGMLLSPFAGNLVRHYGSKRVLNLGMLLAAAGLALLGISASLPLVVLCSVVFVSGISLTIPTLISLIGSLGKSSIAISVYSFILFLGATLGPVITLPLLGSVSFLAVFEILALFPTLGFAFTFFLREGK